MTQKARISKLEASLTAKQKLYSWLKHAKLSGGLIPYWKKELTGLMLPLEWLTDEEARFLWHLVIDANVEILRCMHANDELWRVVHLALDGVVRQIARPDSSGIFVPVRPIPELAAHVGRYLCATFQGIWEETLCLQAAMEKISQAYLEGEDILFADSRGAMDTATANFHDTAYMCGAIARWLNLEGVTFAAEAFSSQHPLVQAKVTRLANLSRVEALRCTATRGQLIQAIKGACPDLAHA